MHACGAGPHLPGRGVLGLGVLARGGEQRLDLQHVPRACVRQGGQHHLCITADALAQRLGHLRACARTPHQPCLAFALCHVTWDSTWAFSPDYR